MSFTSRSPGISVASSLLLQSTTFIRAKFWILGAGYLLTLEMMAERYVLQMRQRSMVRGDTSGQLRTLR